MSSSTPNASVTDRSIVVVWYLQATAAPGASVNVECSAVQPTTGVGSNGGSNNTASPIAIATNAAQTITLTSQWGSAGTGVNTMRLAQFIVEVLG